ncbi:alpha/beta hydrolase [Algoriphagus pacificus]|uniref:Alpha/beta hydrolase n=1 Tax=Algoriphagus pacificus TaxID=2811234 RepID=A0ABS3CAL0_9BACT|nr:alpha/beta hydrolase [Algoriphagus pacificus]MBN7814145.1 alpha/beta hydrolase [Algoriphagus pacificus]
MNKLIFKLRFLIVLSFSIVLFSCNNDSENPAAELEAIDILNESYGSTAENSMDVYLPAGRSTSETPLFIYIHGGAWVSGDKSEIQTFRSLVETSFPDYAIISLNYTLLNLGTGAGQFPDQENDIIDAINYILSKTNEWNISKNIILAGASAGGHLALLHAYKHQEIGNIQAVLALFPPTDLVSLYDFNSLTQQGLQILVNGTPDSNPTGYAQSSPITFVNSNSIPTVFFHGTADIVVPVTQSEILAEKLEENNVPYYFEAYPGEGHGFDFGPYAEVIQKAADFIEGEL